MIKFVGRINLNQTNFRMAPMSGVVNLFGSESLGIFEKASDRSDALETWAKLQQRELKLAVTHPPSNYFGKIKLHDNLSLYKQLTNYFRENDSMDGARKAVEIPDRQRARLAFGKGRRFFGARSP